MHSIAGLLLEVWETSQFCNLFACNVLDTGIVNKLINYFLSLCNGVSLLTDLVDLQLHILSFIIYKCSSKLLSKFSPTVHHACAFLVGTGTVYGAGGVESICTLNVCKMCDFFSLDRSLEEHSL